MPTPIVGRLHTLKDRLVPRGAIVLSVLTFGSYVMGLIRDRILTSTYGAGVELDTFNAAFVIPELTFGVIVASGLAAPFIPIFTGLRTADSDAAAHRFGQTILTLAVLAMGVVAIVLFVIAPWTVEIVAPGFGPAQRALYVDLFRIMCVTQVLFAGSMALGEVLVVERRFASTRPHRCSTTPASSSARWSSPRPSASPPRRSARSWAPPAPGHPRDRHHPDAVPDPGPPRRGHRRHPRLLPIDVAQDRASPLEPITFLFFTNVASSMAAGSITTVNLARNFASVPVSLVGVAFAIAAFPVLASTYAAGDRGGFIRFASRTAGRWRP